MPGFFVLRGLFIKGEKRIFFPAYICIKKNPYLRLYGRKVGFFLQIGAGKFFFDRKN